MRYDKESDHYVLSTGKRFYANNGILGLDIEGRGLYEGYDGGVHFEGKEDQELTRAEKQEIAKVMIARWKTWAGLA